jgi:excisionase family DNA binding protein
MPTELLTDWQAADVMKLSRATFHKLVARGDIERIKIGRSARYSRRDLEDFIERCRDGEREHGGA